MTNRMVVALLRSRVQMSKQSAVARDLGVSPQFIYDVLRGARKPSDRVLAYLGLKRETQIVNDAPKKRRTP